MKEVETKVVVKGLKQCVSDSQVLKSNLPLYRGYTRKNGLYVEADFGFVVYNAEEDRVYFTGIWWGNAQPSWVEDPDIYRIRIIEPITMKEVREFVQHCRNSRK